MENKVIYTITLKDLLSNALSQAEKKAKSLDETLGGLGKTAIAAFGAYEAFNFVKDSVAAFDEAAQASALLDNTLQNTGRTAAGFREALDKQAESLMDVSRFDDDAITGAQKYLAAQKNISDEMVLKTIPAIVDVASSLKMDLGQASEMAAKALAKPESAARMLKGMNIILNDSQEKTIKKLTETGKTAEAQAIILQLMTDKYKGAGKIAAETGEGPFIVLKNKLGNVTEAFGGVVVSIVESFMPAIKVVGDLLKGFTKFLTEHEGAVKAFAVGVTIAAGAFGAWRVYTMGAAIATRIMSINMAQLNLLMRNNALGIVITAVAALGAALYYAWENFEGFRKFVYGVFEVVKNTGEILGTYLEALKDKIVGTLTLDDEQVKRGAEKWKAAGKLAADAWKKGQDAGAASFAASQTQKGLIPDKVENDKKTDEEEDKKIVSEPKGAPTTKATTITITIDKLVESLSVNTTNIQESTSKIRELVATALTDALNDSQIIAGG